VNKISNTWELAKVSWGVLRDDKELALLPVLSALCAILVSATFVVPLIVAPEILNAMGVGVAKYLGMFLFYLVNYFVVIFFNTALIHAATIRLRGGHPTVADGLGFAFDNVGRILQWAAVAATVGMILRAIEERVGWLGKFVVAMLGAAWTLATYFVVPVIVYEQLGPIAAVKRSAQMFRETWGERLVSAVSFGLLFFLLAIPAFIAPVLAGVLLGTTAALVVLAIAVLYVIALAVVNAALNGIFVAALYQYTQSKEACGPFSPQLLNSAWRPR
jgi:hypothetical protein